MNRLTLLAFFLLSVLPTSTKASQVIFDSHVHLFSYQNWGQKAVGSKKVIQALDTAKVDKALVISAGYRFSSGTKAKIENDFVAAEIAKTSGRLVGFCSVHILQDWALRETRRCIKKLRLKGLKLHPTNNGIDFWNADHVKKLRTLAAEASKLNIPVLMHANLTESQIHRLILKVTITNPKTTFILAHAFGVNYRLLGSLATEPEVSRNLYADLSHTANYFADSPEREVFLWNLRKFGIDRLFFGSDYPVVAPAKAILAVKEYGLKPDELKQIFSKNLEAFFKRYKTN